MAFVDTVAERLAQETFQRAESAGLPELIDQVGRVLGESSPTLQEAYNTAIRYLRAEARAKALLDKQGGAGS